MPDLSYQPTFHHDRWVDRQDRVLAEGSNGFNVRFEAIERDLQQASTVVGQISVALAEASSPPQPALAQLTLTPVLSGFFLNTVGVPVGAVHEFQDGATGSMNLALPDRVRLQNLRLIFDISGGDGFTRLDVKVSRLPLRLTIPPPSVQVLATASHNAFGINTEHVVLDVPFTATLAVVDLSTFRYFLGASFTGQSIGVAEVAINSVQIQYATV